VSRELPTLPREKTLRAQGRADRLGHVHVSPIFRPDGSVRHLVSQIIDATERKRTAAGVAPSTRRASCRRWTHEAGPLGISTWRPSVSPRRKFYKLVGTSAVKEGTFEMSADRYDRRFLRPTRCPGSGGHEPGGCRRRSGHTTRSSTVSSGRRLHRVMSCVVAIGT